MPRTIEVEIDRQGRIRPLEPSTPLPPGRALLTLLPSAEAATNPQPGSPGNPVEVLTLLRSSAFRSAPAGDVSRMDDIILENRNAWDD